MREEQSPKPGRPARKPVSQRAVLIAPTRPGYIRRWVNDTEGRVKMFEEGGWRPVKNQDGIETADKMVESSLGSVVTRHVGGNTKSVLMEIQENYYQEDQAAKAAKVRDTERDILSRRSDGQYGKIEINR